MTFINFKEMFASSLEVSEHDKQIDAKKNIRYTLERTRYELRCLFVFVFVALRLRGPVFLVVELR